MKIRRIRGAGWLALLGGGEFSFGETEEADHAWLEKTPDGKVGFLPAASGSTEYGQHFATYLGGTFGREVEALPIYRARDGRRGKNRQRIENVAAVYLGGGVPDQLLDAVRETPCAEALAAKLESGGTLAAMAAAAQCAGQVARSMFGGGPVPGLGWLPGGVVEPNFDPAHDRRLRQLMTAPGVDWGLGLPASSALLLGPEGEAVALGTVFVLSGPDEDFEVLQQSSPSQHPTEGDQESDQKEEQTD